MVGTGVFTFSKIFKRNITLYSSSSVCLVIFAHPARFSQPNRRTASYVPDPLVVTKGTKVNTPHHGVILLRSPPWSLVETYKSVQPIVMTQLQVGSSMAPQKHRTIGRTLRPLFKGMTSHLMMRQNALPSKEMLT